MSERAEAHERYASQTLGDVPREVLVGALLLAAEEVASSYYAEESKEEALARLLEWAPEAKRILHLREFGPVDA